MSNWQDDKPQLLNDQIKITLKGAEMLIKADASGSIFPNEIHLLSGIRNGKTWLISHFEKQNYVNPPLERCVAYLVKNGYAELV